MLNDSAQEQLNYSMILLKHIDRISVLSTMIREDGSDSVNYSTDARAKAIFQSIYTLKALIPSSLKDNAYEEAKKKETERYLKQMDSLKEQGVAFDEAGVVFYHRTCELNIVIDLLNRKGMLLSERFPARAKGNKGISEVFE